MVASRAKLLSCYVAVKLSVTGCSDVKWLLAELSCYVAVKRSMTGCEVLGGEVFHDWLQ